jgi:hypothetical protein
MKRSFNASVLSIVLFAFLAGCTGHTPPKRLSALTKNATKSGPDLQASDAYLRARFCQELLLRFGVKSYDEDGPGAALTNCLNDDSAGASYPRDAFSIALSGGGTRSASFSMGILKALNEAGMLEQADAISSVSGGGYTSYWLMSQRFYGSMYVNGSSYPADRRHYKKVLEDLERAGANAAATSFCQQVKAQSGALKPLFLSRTDGDVLDQDAWQRHIASQSDIINYSQNGFIQRLETGGLVATHVVMTPIYWATDGLFHLRVVNGSVFTNAYRKGLERTYGLAPNAEHNAYVDYFDHDEKQYLNAMNGAFLRWREASRTEELHFKQLREFALAYNTCADALARTGVSVPPVSMPIINTKLSRPYSFFFKDDKSFDMKSLEKSIFTFTPVQWGSAHTDYQHEEKMFAPIPFSKVVATSGAAVDEGARELRGVGDFAVAAVNMNLGYKVRNPKTQQSAAGTAWYWTYKLLGGFPLRYIVPEKHQATLRLSDGGHAENLGLYSLIERGTRRILVVDAEHDPDYEFESLKRIKANLKSQLNIELSCAKDGEPDNCPLAGNYMQNQGDGVFELKASGFPWQEDSMIIYVKLSVDERLVADNLPAVDDGSACLPSLAGLDQTAPAYPCNVARYYESERHRNNAFPHNSTADVWYGETQYEAYRDLAYFLGVTRVNPLIQSWKAEVEREREQARKVVEGYRSQ